MVSDIVSAAFGLGAIWLGWNIAKPKPPEPRRATLERQPDGSLRSRWVGVPPRPSAGVDRDIRPARRAYWFLQRTRHRPHRHRRF